MPCWWKKDWKAFSLVHPDNGIFNILRLMTFAIRTFFKKHWETLLAIVSVNLFIYLFTRHSGIGISPDSVSYSSAALNIRQHFSFTDFNGLPLVNFPVGYPVFLAAFSYISGLTPLSVAPAVNGALLSLVILFTSIILSGYKKSSRFYKLVFLSILAVSPALLEVYSMLWSETLFIFLSVLFCYCAYRYLVGHNYTTLLAMALVSALAFVTRYAGISLVLTGCILIFFDGELPILKKIKHLLVFGLAGISLATVNLLHNHLATESLAGVREKALRSFSDNILQAGDVVAGWLPFLKNLPGGGVVFFPLVLIAALCILCFRILQQQYYHTYETILSAFFVSYILFILTVASISRFEDLSNRLLSPVYIPLLLIASSWIPVMLRKITRIKKLLLLSLSVFLLAAMHRHQYQQNAEAWEGIKDAGIPGYAEDSWQHSPTIQYIKSNKNVLGPSRYSDANDAVYFLTGIQALPLPHKEIAAEIHDLLQQPSFSVIWLNDGVNDDLVDIRFIQQYKKLERITELEDGAIYYFSGNTDWVPR